MKSSFKPFHLKLLAVLVIAIVVVIIHSCKKDKTESSPQINTPNPTVNLAKKWYDSVYSNAATSGRQTMQSVNKLSQDWSKKFFPVWSKANTFIQNGMAFIELPATKNGDMGVSFKRVADSANYNFIKSGTMTDLLIVKTQNGFGMYAMTILADSSYLKGDYSKVYRNSYFKMDSTFTGAVFFHQMDGTFINGWRYLNGQVIRQLSAAPAGSVQSINSLKTNVAESPCTNVTVTTYWEDCSYWENDINFQNPFNCYIYTTTATYADCSDVNPGGSGSPPPPCQVPTVGSSSSSGSSGNSPMGSSIIGKLIINVTTGGSGSSGGTTNPPPTLQPCPVNQVVTVVRTKDPCIEKAAVSSRSSNPVISNQNEQILNNSTTYEYGVSENLTDIDASTFVNTLVAPNNPPSTNSYTPIFSWDSVNGYTVGFSHGHPDNSPPDPFDVLPMIVNSSNSTLVAAGPSAVQFYQNNISSTVVTVGGNYVVTVNNWEALQSVYNTFLSEGSRAFINSYQQYADNYQINNPSATLDEAGEYALMKLFGNAINVYFADPNSNSFTPLEIDSSGKVAKTQC